MTYQVDISEDTVELIIISAMREIMGYKVDELCTQETVDAATEIFDWYGGNVD